MKLSSRGMAWLAGATLLLTLATASTTPKGWHRHVDPAGGYATSFPTKPQVLKQDASGETLHVAAAETRTGAVLVMWTDFGPKIEGTPSDLLLKGALDGITGKPGVKVISLTAAQFQGHPARDVTFEQDGARFRNLMFLKGTRLYQLMVVGPEKKDVAPLFKEAFAGFELKK
jgi:hypothetical protein